jgi:hypothetical protein
MTFTVGSVNMWVFNLGIKGFSWYSFRHLKAIPECVCTHCNVGFCLKVCCRARRGMEMEWADSVEHVICGSIQRNGWSSNYRILIFRIENKSLFYLNGPKFPVLN